MPDNALPEHLSRTLDHITEEARKTKPWSYTLLNAVALLITERYERMILTRDEAIVLLAHVLRNGVQ